MSFNRLGKEGARVLDLILVRARRMRWSQGKCSSWVSLEWWVLMMALFHPTILKDWGP